MNSQVIADDVGVIPPDEMNRLASGVQRRANGRVREFRLLVFSNGLILQGLTSTYYAKQLAQHAIMEATQVPILANDIEVRPH